MYARGQCCLENHASEEQVVRLYLASVTQEIARNCSKFLVKNLVNLNVRLVSSIGTIAAN